jgi:ankyrin repeat protein
VLNKQLIDSLFNKIAIGNLSEVKKLLEKSPALINITDHDDAAVDNKYGDTLLHYAVNNNSIELAQFLIKLNENLVNKPNKYRHTPIHIAAEYGFNDMIDLLLKNGADINAIDQGGHTALHIAAAGRRKETIKLLIKNEINPTLRAITGYASDLARDQDIVNQINDYTDICNKFNLRTKQLEIAIGLTFVTSILLVSTDIGLLLKKHSGIMLLPSTILSLIMLSASVIVCYQNIIQKNNEIDKILNEEFLAIPTNLNNNYITSIQNQNKQR